jgi:hypothetical protein
MEENDLSKHGVASEQTSWLQLGGRSSPRSQPSAHFIGSIVLCRTSMSLSWHSSEPIMRPEAARTIIILAPHVWQSRPLVTSGKLTGVGRDERLCLAKSARVITPTPIKVSPFYLCDFPTTAYRHSNDGNILGIYGGRGDLAQLFDEGHLLADFVCYRIYVTARCIGRGVSGRPPVGD